MTIKRRRLFAFLLTNEPAQRYFIGMQFVILSVILLFLLYSAFDLFRQFAWSAEALNLTAGQYQPHLKDLYQALALRTAVIFGAGFLLNIFFGLAFLHRVTGPLRRVESILNQIAKGEFPDAMVHFRHGDFSQGLAIALSRLIDFLNRMRVSMKPEKEKR